MSRIVLVNPPLKVDDITGVYGNLYGVASSSPPQGLCHLAAILRKNGFSVSILDAQALSLDRESAMRAILRQSPRYVGITAATVSIHSAARLAEGLKETNKNLVTIIGGYHFTALPEETLRQFWGFDIGVLGEGEMTILDLIQTIENKGSLAKVKGIAFKENGKIIITGKRPFIQNLDVLPTPAWDLLPNPGIYYRQSAQRINTLPTFTLITSRGCPGQCRFCDRSVFGQTYRRFSVHYIIELIQHLKSKYGIKGLIIHDDTFMLSHEFLSEFCETMINKKIKLSWSCNGTINLKNKDILRLMRRAGCWQIAYGLESGSQKILDSIGKNITLKQIADSLRWTKQAKISTKGFFMIGVPQESVETLNQTLKFIRTIALDDIQVTFFTPYPGTEFFKTVVEKEHFIPDWHKMTSLYPIYVPQGLDEKTLIYYQKEMTKEFYLRPIIFFAYFKRLKKIRYFIHILKEGRYFFQYLAKKL
jgi:radical SAM superfamily enzyme YgiQ (UPF0313 family)